MNHIIHRAQLLGYPTIYLEAKKTDYYRRQGWCELNQYLHQVEEEEQEATRYMLSHSLLFHILPATSLWAHLMRIDHIHQLI